MLGIKLSGLGGTSEPNVGELVKLLQLCFENSINLGNVTSLRLILSLLTERYILSQIFVPHVGWWSECSILTVSLQINVNTRVKTLEQAWKLCKDFFTGATALPSIISYASGTR